MNWRAGFLVAIWFLVGVVIFAITKDWQIVAAIATWLLAGSVGFAISQVRQARKSTNAQLAVELFLELHNPKTKEKLGFIYGLKSEDFENLQDTTRKDIEHVLDRLEMLGALVAKGIIDKKLTIETYGGTPALRCWYQLGEHYIRKEQRKRGYYAEDYEEFANSCVEHFDREEIRVGFYNQYVTIDNLVTELQKPELRPRSSKEIKNDRRKTKRKANP